MSEANSSELGTLSDIGRHHEPKMATTKTGSGNKSRVISTSGVVADILSSRCQPMSGHVGIFISELGMVENVRDCRWNRYASSFRSRVIFTSRL